MILNNLRLLLIYSTMHRRTPIRRDVVLKGCKRSSDIAGVCYSDRKSTAWMRMSLTRPERCSDRRLLDRLKQLKRVEFQLMEMFVPEEQILGSWGVGYELFILVL